MAKDKRKLKKAERRKQRKVKYSEFEAGKDARIKKIVESISKLDVKVDAALIKENDQAIRNYHRRTKWDKPKRKE